MTQLEIKARKIVEELEPMLKQSKGYYIQKENIVAKIFNILAD